MFETPQKSFPSKITSLRQKIENKISTDRKILDIKQNIFKNYQSHAKNSNQSSLFHNLSKQNFASNHDDGQIKKKGSNSFFSNQTVEIHHQITQNNILQFQSLQNRKFYGFEEWIEFNKKFFGHVETQCVKNIWKIMRIINYGDVWIPSGLIYEISKVLTSHQNGESLSLKQVFNQFLKFNHATDQVNNFRQLKNLSSFEQIQRAYRKQKIKQKPSSSIKNKHYSSLKKLPSNTDVFQRAYHDSKIRNQKLTQNIHRSLVEKQIKQQCVFKPQISQYCPQKLFIDESFKPSRDCYSKNKWMTQRLTQNDFTRAEIFKATPFDRSRYENKILDQIPGVSQYIDRRKSSQAKKRKLERYSQRPTLVFRHDY